jgi:hypothetical protein
MGGSSILYNKWH